MSDVETPPPPPPAANGAATTDADVAITSSHPDSSTVIPKLMSKIQLLEQDLVNGQLKIKNLQDEISSHESDKRALTSIASRASDLETELSRLQHDLIASLSDAQEANAEANDLKRKVADFESKERESVEKLKVIEIERNLLLEKVKESETENARKISGFEAKERENEEKISLLVEKLEEVKEKERVKTERIDALMEKLKESERKISELESEGNNKNVKVNEMLAKLDILQKEIVSKEVEVESNDGTINWPVIAVSAGAVVTLGLVYFRHAKF